MKVFARDGAEKLVNQVLQARQEFFSKNPKVKAKFGSGN
jgi:hypothetical protein